MKQVLAIAIQREAREDVLHNVVVTDVEVTPDLSLARVFYYAMGGEPEAIDAALHRAAPFLRRRVGEEIRARHTPELRFLVDTSIERGRRVEEILHQLAEDATASDGEGDEDGGGDGVAAEPDGDERD